jgi:hypothetical protein
LGRYGNLSIDYVTTSGTYWIKESAISLESRIADMTVFNI